MKKKCLLILIASIILHITSTTNSYANPVAVRLNGVYVNVEAIIVNDRVLVPVRSIIELLNGKVEWNEARKQAIISYEDMNIIMQPSASFAFVNDDVIFFDAPPQIINERMYLPLRFTAETLGIFVDFVNGTVFINTNQTPITTPSQITTLTPEHIPTPMAIAPTDTPIPAPSSPAQTDSQTMQEQTKLELIWITSPVKRAAIASVVVKGEPYTEYSILVMYQNKSTAAGVSDENETKLSDADGIAAWSWLIGSNTTQKDHYLIISGGDDIIIVDFTVE